MCQLVLPAVLSSPNGSAGSAGGSALACSLAGSGFLNLLFNGMVCSSGECTADTDKKQEQTSGGVEN